MRELWKLQDELSTKRLNICFRCPLYIDEYGGMCNSKLWLNVKTGDVTTKKRSGYVQGCGCNLQLKTQNSTAQCPAGKW